MQRSEYPIYVTQPALPPLDEFTEYLKQIWETKILTNNGPFHQQFEKELADYLGVKYLSVFANGTLALVTALQALRITGEVITTPFSFVATTHALWWNNIKPVFADIESDYFTLDPEKIESAITPQTTAILPVHVYGNPCKLEAIQKIADTYGLKVIYDAAHAFGVKVNGNSILNYGDLSILSFHATKTFNTIEGGAIISPDESTKKRVDFLKNFGFADEVTVIEPGINAKMNELQAAYGLVQLKHVDEFIGKRKVIAELYRQKLAGVKGIRFLIDKDNVSHSYTYFPILIDVKSFGATRDELYEKLKEYNIFGRRYFYPLISQFPTYRSLPSAHKANLPEAEKVAEQVLCLPIYPLLKHDDLDLICNVIINLSKQKR
jgi:dTDP-4-amino-4,6-dideoxygalactose transaminase